MSQADANPPKSSTPPKPSEDKPKSEAKKMEKSSDWGAVGGLFLVLLGLIFVIGNATGLGESQNSSPVSAPNEPEFNPVDFNPNYLEESNNIEVFSNPNESEFNEVDFNPNYLEENQNIEPPTPIEPELNTPIANQDHVPVDPHNHLPYIPSQTPCLEQPIYPPPKPKPVKKH